VNPCHLAPCGYLRGSVPAGIPEVQPGDARERAPISMQLQEIIEIDIKERVTIHHKKIGSLLQMTLSEFYCSRGAQWDVFPSSIQSRLAMCYRHRTHSRSGSP
jgi:hypothetical protein